MIRRYVIVRLSNGWYRTEYGWAQDLQHAVLYDSIPEATKAVHAAGLQERTQVVAVTVESV